MSGRVAAIWKKREHGGPMDRVDQAVLVAGEGLQGSADQGGLRQVTLIEAETFETIAGLLGRTVDPAARRANLLLRGIALADTRGRTLALGPARILIHGETRPCGIMDAAVPGLRAALAVSWRGGVYGEVIAGGTISLGDPAVWVQDGGASDASSP